MQSKLYNTGKITSKKYDQKNTPINYQMWTEHKRVIIANELKYVLSLAKVLQITDKDQIKKYDSGFLYEFRKSDKTIDTKILQGTPFQKQQCKNYQYLIKCLNALNQSQIRDLRDMIFIILEIKHRTYRKQFIPIYELICENVMKQNIDDIVRADYREKWQKNITDDIINMIKDKKNTYPQLSYLKEKIGLEKFQNFIKIEAYCILAEYFNFEVNQYFIEMFGQLQDEVDKIDGQKKEKAH